MDEFLNEALFDPRLEMDRADIDWSENEGERARDGIMDREGAEYGDLLPKAFDPESDTQPSARPGTEPDMEPGTKPHMGPGADPGKEPDPGPDLPAMLRRNGAGRAEFELVVLAVLIPGWK
ncbi:hypothetical protein BC939DRAFT_512245 [Gamsiella multidivaricata]|uniref:uncharacterized protein n=1 Tax=Gamsiella multidivaricata TaxID=101098 RepID=UPI002220C4BE|nr:uncharacterized protein BC939DRAFT_512245 [Gamsiella multidivaricata]KAI7828155.1 hypothetical protein BC939DRAFT_512245 [Gamsiella multidivaricata]